jgi:hypothetical protein
MPFSKKHRLFLQAPKAKIDGDIAKILIITVEFYITF